MSDRKSEPMNWITVLALLIIAILLAALVAYCQRPEREACEAIPGAEWSYNPIYKRHMCTKEN